MLLHEITNDEFWDDISNAYPPEMQARAKELKKQQKRGLGAGTNAYVYHDEDPHDIKSVKRHGSEEYDTGYLTYAKAILQHPTIKNNPYIPKIRAINTAGGVIEYVIEKLVASDNPKIINPLMLKAALSKWFTKEGLKNLDDTMGNRDTLTPLSVIEAVAFVIEECVVRPGVATQYIKDPQLIEAIQFIHNVSRQNDDITVDIHVENIMWRITGTMPQLVITDPLY